MSKWGLFEDQEDPARWDVGDVPNPPLSPNEKVLIPRKQWAAAEEATWLEVMATAGVDHELAGRLSRALSAAAEQGLMDEESNLRTLEHWSNIHTHAQFDYECPSGTVPMRSWDYDRCSGEPLPWGDLVWAGYEALPFDVDENGVNHDGGPGFDAKYVEPYWHTPSGDLWILTWHIKIGPWINYAGEVRPYNPQFEGDGRIGDTPQGQWDIKHASTHPGNRSTYDPAIAQCVWNNISQGRGNGIVPHSGGQTIPCNDPEPEVMPSAGGSASPIRAMLTMIVEQYAFDPHMAYHTINTYVAPVRWGPVHFRHTERTYDEPEEYDRWWATEWETPPEFDMKVDWVMGSSGTGGVLDKKYQDFVGKVYIQTKEQHEAQGFITSTPPGELVISEFTPADSGGADGGVGPNGTLSVPSEKFSDLVPANVYNTHYANPRGYVHFLPSNSWLEGEETLTLVSPDALYGGLMRLRMTVSEYHIRPSRYRHHMFVCIDC